MSRAREVVSDHSVSDSETMRFNSPYLSHMYECIEFEDTNHAKSCRNGCVNINKLNK